MNDWAFVYRLYCDLLGREPAGDEAVVWERALLNGASRYAVFLGFVQSDEFQARFKAAAGA